MFNITTFTQDCIFLRAVSHLSELVHVHLCFFQNNLLLYTFVSSNLTNAQWLYYCQNIDNYFYDYDDDDDDDDDDDLVSFRTIIKPFSD